LGFYFPNSSPDILARGSINVVRSSRETQQFLSAATKEFPAGLSCHLGHGQEAFGGSKQVRHRQDRVQRFLSQAVFS